MVPTKELKKTLSENGFLNLKVVSRGVDTSLFNMSKRDPDLRKAWGATDQSQVMISVGRMAPEKNLEQVLKTFEALKLLGTDLKLVMVGDGPLREQFQLKYPEIIFPGMLVQSELAKYYASADLFVFPSTTDTYGNVVVEAMASGLPVVVSDQGGPSELLRDPRDGERVVTGDVGKWISAIERLSLGQNSVKEREARRQRTVMGRSWSDAFDRFWNDALL
jgi:glycosyltransferase involved in cell wall biosynthesis